MEMCKAMADNNRLYQLLGAVTIAYDSFDDESALIDAVSERLDVSKEEVKSALKLFWEQKAAEKKKQAERAERKRKAKERRMARAAAKAARTEPVL